MVQLQNELAGVQNEVAREIERILRPVSYTHLDVYKRQLVERVALFDLYEGAQIPKDRRSLAFTITYRHPDRTLTESEINAAHSDIETALFKLGAELRS